MRLPTRLLRQARRRGRDQSVDRLLQSPAASQRPWRADAGSGISGWPLALWPGLLVMPAMNIVNVGQPILSLA